MTRFSSVLLFIFILQVLFGETSSAGSCQNYEKGEFSGNVTSKEICRTACEVAEGLCCPDFKENNGTYKCSCVSCEGSCSNKQTRSLCEDGGFSSGANGFYGGYGLGGATVTSLLLASLI